MKHYYCYYYYYYCYYYYYYYYKDENSSGLYLKTQLSYKMMTPLSSNLTLLLRKDSRTVSEFITITHSSYGVIKVTEIHKNTL